MVSGLEPAADGRPPFPCPNSLTCTPGKHGQSVSGIGQFGAGAAIGATGVATAAATMAGTMAAAGATQGAGGVSALMAAFSQANANIAAGSDVLANAFSGGDGGDTDGGPGGGGMPGTGAPFQRHCHEGHGIFKTVLGIRLLNFSS